MRVLLLCGFAFEGLADALQGGLVVGIEDIGERAFGFTVALGDELHHLDCGDQDGGDELFERAVLLLAQGFDIEALGLHGAEHLLDGPAQAVKADDPARIGDVVDPMGGEQEPQRRLLALGRIDLAADDECHADGCGQTVGGGAMFGPLDLDLAEADGQRSLAGLAARRGWQIHLSSGRLRPTTGPC